MLISPTASVAIDVGSYETKIVTGHWAGKQLVVDRALVLPTPEGSVKDGLLTSQDDRLAELLRGALSDLGVRRGQACFTINCTRTIVREVTLPFSKDRQLRSMVGFEIAKHFPIKASDYVTDFRSIEQITEDGIRKIRLQVIALPKDVEEGYWSLSEAIGLRATSLEVQADGMIRWLNHQASPSDSAPITHGASLLVDFGHRQLTMSFRTDLGLALTRTVSGGGAFLDQALSLALDINTEQAKALKHTGSLVPKDGVVDSAELVRFRALLRSGVEHWVAEIQQALRYYLGLSESNRIDVIYMYGGSAQLGGLVEHMQDAFNRPAELLRVGSDFPHDVQPTASDQRLLPAIGALMRPRRETK